MTVTAESVGPGVTRLNWSATGRDEFWQAVTQVQNAVADAFATGAQRVEAHVEVTDTRRQRIAIISGLLREGVARGVAAGADRIVFARVSTDIPVSEPEGFRTLLNSTLPRKRAIGQLFLRDPDNRVMLCQLTYKPDWDLPGGVVEVGESPRVGALREVAEELQLELPSPNLLLVDWMPAWSGWDDANCFLFDAGVHEVEILDRIVRQEREIKAVEFCTPTQVAERCADFTARRIEAAWQALADGATRYVESGRTV